MQIHFSNFLHNQPPKSFFKVVKHKRPIQLPGQEEIWSLSKAVAFSLRIERFPSTESPKEKSHVSILRKCCHKRNYRNHFCKINGVTLPFERNFCKNLFFSGQWVFLSNKNITKIFIFIDTQVA